MRLTIRKYREITPSLLKKEGSNIPFLRVTYRKGLSAPNMSMHFESVTIGKLTIMHSIEWFQSRKTVSLAFFKSFQNSRKIGQGARQYCGFTEKLPLWGYYRFGNAFRLIFEWTLPFWNELSHKRIIGPLLPNNTRQNTAEFLITLHTLINVQGYNLQHIWY